MTRPSIPPETNLTTPEWNWGQVARAETKPGWTSAKVKVRCESQENVSSEIEQEKPDERIVRQWSE